MASKIKLKKYSRTATETNADIFERIGGSGGAAYRSTKSKRPDILKLKKKSTPLTTKSETRAMVKTNKKASHPKLKTKSSKKKLVRVAKVTGGASALGTSAAVGYSASQWINQNSDKKK
jgi:hypothetical protein